MRVRFVTMVMAAALLAQASQAEVIDADASGFTVAASVEVSLPREALWLKATAEIAAWWQPEHTISGDAGRLSLDARPLGCFCERLGAADAGVVHLTVTMANPGVVLRLTGGLGPLGLLGTNGNMTWEFTDTDAKTTRVTMTYAVGGYRQGGLDELAGPVDRVIVEALTRLKSYAEHGDAEHAARH